MLYFCTLFDSNYLARGLVTYESLMSATEGSAHLYVFAFDDLCLTTLKGMNLPNLTVVSLAEFEDEDLLRIKPTRSRGEYCWTCTSSTIHYCINQFDLPHCIYIDADMVFYENPQILINEMPPSANVLITEHRYTPAYDKSKLSGKYCVQFMYFDNSENGKRVLNWWRDRCLEWCYNRHEDGKFGDQKYLDDWLTRFSGVHSLQHFGGGLAPWNVQRFDFQEFNGKIMGQLKAEKTQYTDLSSGTREGSNFEAVFFHFHGVKLFERNKSIFAPKMYLLNETAKALFYNPYLQKLKAAQTQLVQLDSRFEKLGILSMADYNADKKRGWFAYLKANYLNQLF
jgi:Nucleotide-diphospho-sugar transferase